MYFEDHGLSEISRVTGISEGALSYYACRRKDGKTWYKEREDREKKVWEKVLTHQGRRIDSIVSLSTAALERFLERLIRRESEMDIKEAKLLSDVLANVHRIQRLENNEATDIRHYENMTPEQIREATIQALADIKKNDPFYNSLALGEDMPEDKAEIPEGENGKGGTTPGPDEPQVH
jgi:hypothetical protein